MVVLVASEATLFGTLIGTYFYLRFDTAQWPPDGIAKPELWTPLGLALGLALSTVPFALAARAAAAGRLAAVRVLVAGALLLQAAYLGYALHDLAGSLDRFTPQRDAYGSITYVLLGADHAHVAAGLLLDLWLLGKLGRGLNGYRARSTRVIAVYWYAVAGLTLAVTGTILSAAA
jgi:heme/copper-type cytochrome/quinol oxidase subunit 3